MEKRYKCLECKYEWVPKSDRTPIKCPNCASKQILNKKEHYKALLSREEVDVVE